MPTSSPVEERPPTPLSLLYAIRQRINLFFWSILVGLFLGLVAYLFTPTVYGSKGTFFINKLPFNTMGEMQTDAETERQLVQSLILSIPGEELRKAIAVRLNVPDTDLAFADHDRTLSLTGSNKQQANISVTATRNSRLGVVSAESRDPQFATQVVSAVFDEIANINKIAGQIDQVGSRLKVGQSEADKLVQELTTASSDRIKFEQENQALDEYLAQKHALENFPGFGTDVTLSNIKTQLILVQAEYDAVASQSSSGAKLAGKKAELNGLRQQINDHLAGLVTAIRSSLQIARTREDSLRSQLIEVQKTTADLQNLQAQLTKGLGNYKVREDLVAHSDLKLNSEASVIVVIDPPYAIDKPLRPSLSIDLGLGLLFGIAVGIGSIMLLLQINPTNR